jgi:predicted lipoprotein with Yx(FWY)xxD motif
VRCRPRHYPRTSIDCSPRVRRATFAEFSGASERLEDGPRHGGLPGRGFAHTPAGVHGESLHYPRTSEKSLLGADDDSATASQYRLRGPSHRLRAPRATEFLPNQGASMTRSRFKTFLAAAALPLTALALAVVASGAEASSAPHGTLATARIANGSTVEVRASKLGRILVNSQGHTLYIFKKDSRGKSTCTGACAKFWPPLRVSGKPTAGRGVSASKLGTIKRSDGKPQVRLQRPPALHLPTGHTGRTDERHPAWRCRAVGGR